MHRPQKERAKPCTAAFLNHWDQYRDQKNLSGTRKFIKSKDLTYFADLIFKNKIGSMSSGCKIFRKCGNRTVPIKL
jgi:hypothetical protein